MTIEAIKKIDVRFFIYDEEVDDIRECDESEFIESEYPIEYERHTIFSNGARQICLTKSPEF